MTRPLPAPPNTTDPGPTPAGTPTPRGAPALDAGHHGSTSSRAALRWAARHVAVGGRVLRICAGAPSPVRVVAG